MDAFAVWQGNNEDDDNNYGRKKYGQPSYVSSALFSLANFIYGLALNVFSWLDFFNLVSYSHQLCLHNTSIVWQGNDGDEYGGNSYGRNKYVSNAPIYLANFIYSLVLNCFLMIGFVYFCTFND